jgi:hypothetical protein
MTVHPDRLHIVESLSLLSGSHSSFKAGACLLEAVSYVAGEPWSDHPKCVSPVLAAFGRSWNDALDDATRQRLKVYIPRLIGTAGSSEIDERRAWMATDWACRVSAPVWLRKAGLVAEAEALEALPEIVDSASAKAAQGALNRAKTKAAAAWAAAGAAAGAAAWAAAWDAAGDAAGDAAWAAAWAAAGDAAGAAAGAAAWAAAGDTLKDTVAELQESAFALLDRMIECGNEVPA